MRRINSRSFTTALSLDPKHAIAHQNLGNAGFHQENYPEALQSYKHSLQIQPTFAKAWFNGGLTHT